jgi:hypothetical protein
MHQDDVFYPDITVPADQRWRLLYFSYSVTPDTAIVYPEMSVIRNGQVVFRQVKSAAVANTGVIFFRPFGSAETGAYGDSQFSPCDLYLDGGSNLRIGLYVVSGTGFQLQEMQGLAQIL